MSIPSIPLSQATPRAVAAGMARAGAVVFPRLLPLPLLKRIRRAVLPRIESGELLARGRVRDIGGRYAAILPFEGVFLEPAFYAHSRLTAILAALLGDDYCIGSLEIVVARSGAVAQHQHIDGPMRFDVRTGARKTPYRGDLSRLPPYAVSLATPLCDVDEENGPTAIWPGSHRDALRARPAGAREVGRKHPVEYMTGRFGSSFLFDYRVFHGGTPNFAREPRPLLNFVFTRPWYRDPNLNEVHPSVVISKGALARMPERRRRLFLLAPAARRELWRRG